MRQGMERWKLDGGWAGEEAEMVGQQNEKGCLLTDEPGVYQLTGDGRPVELPAQEVQAPFLPLTGEDWPEVRERLRRGLERFVSAIDARNAEQVLSAGIEMQAAFSRILLETRILKALPDDRAAPARH
ncbi:MAG TPA: hypothetical protein VHD63_25340 [Ktedonobacteraceae bacterium]|nr:hypothetical protein [Ktedonobacteraceae bacterium]